MDTENSTWQIIAGVLTAVGGFIALLWRNRQAISAKVGTAKTLMVAPLSILGQLEQQAKRDEQAIADRKTFSSRLDRQDVVLEKVLAELTSNGGKSIKDMVKATNELSLITHQMTVISEARIRLLQTMAAACIFECDAQTGECVWVNEGICGLFDLPQSEMLGFGWLRAVAPVERESVKQAWHAAVRGGYPFAWEYTVVRKNGTRQKVCAKASELKDKLGKSLLFQGTVERVD